VGFITKWLDGLAAKLAGTRPFGTDEFLTDLAAARAAVAQAVREFSAAAVGAVADPVDGAAGAGDADITLSIAGGSKPSALQRLKARVTALTSAESLDNLLYEYQDKLVDLKRIRDHIKDISGTISDLNDAYLGEELHHKRVAKRTQDFLSDELKPLLADMRARTVDMPTLETLLHARHAPEANAAMAERNPNQQTIDTKKAAADAQLRTLERQLQKSIAAGGATKALAQAVDQACEERARWTGAQEFKGTEAERLSLSGMAAYKVAIKQGMSKERAASLPKNITVNFNRKGRQTREIGALYAFFNAALQGTARIVEALRGPVGKQIMYGGVLLGAVNTLIGMAMMGADDEDEADNWEQLPEFTKKRSIVIPLGREDYITIPIPIPMPLGFHVFPNIGRIAVEYAPGDSDKSLGGLIGKLLLAITDAFNPLGGSQNLGQLVSASGCAAWPKPHVRRPADAPIRPLALLAGLCTAPAPGMRATPGPRPRCPPPASRWHTRWPCQSKKAGRSPKRT
jgi:hypothetical protein